MIVASHKTDQFKSLQHIFNVPLNYQEPGKGTIQVFARELQALEQNAAMRPYLVFLQGGPGSESPRSLESTGWIKRALKDYRVLLLDQRGTGLSSPITFQTLEPLSPQEQADYLVHFRADNIVRDAEFIRQELSPDEPWSTLGQSFGGFCTLRYLSSAPEGLKEAFITGGISSLNRHIDDVYKATYKIVKNKNDLLFNRYPELQEKCQKVAHYLLANEVTLPNGQIFTVRQFQQLGMALGSSVGFEQLNYLLEHAFVQVKGKLELSYTFLHDCLHASSFIRNPLFSILHEAIYCQGFASRWSAHRIRGEFSEFNYEVGKDFLFTGEMIYPWMFDEYLTLQSFKEAADILAQKDDWSNLYDPDVLSENKVPVAAAIYFHDMYVPLEFSLETAREVPNLKTWVTNEYEHNGLRADGEHIMNKLMHMVSAI